MSEVIPDEALRIFRTGTLGYSLCSCKKAHGPEVLSSRSVLMAKSPEVV